MADSSEQFKSYYGSGPLRHYYSSLHHHEAVEDYFAPHHSTETRRASVDIENSPYAVVERFRQGVEFRGKFIGTTAVPAATGEEMCRSTLAKLRTMVRASKKHKPRVILRLTNKELHIIDQDAEKTLHSIKLHTISYILPDPADQYAFGFISGAKTGPWHFYGLKTVSPSIGTIVAVKELFEALSAISKGNVGSNWDNSVSVIERYKHGIEFRGKLIGSAAVSAPNGDEMCYATLNRLRGEVLASKKHKTKIVMHITDKNVFVIDQDEGSTVTMLPLSSITYVIPDPNDEHAFGLITGDSANGYHFFGFKTVLPSLAPIEVLTELLAAVGAHARCQHEHQHVEVKDRFEQIIDRFSHGGVEFRGKFVGFEMVNSPVGEELCLNTLTKLRTAVAMTKVHKTKVIIHVVGDSLMVKQQDNGALLHSTKILKISFVAADRNDQRAFGFICGERTGPWYFYGFKTVLPSIAVIAAIKDLSEALGEMSKRTGRRPSYDVADADHHHQHHHHHHQPHQGHAEKH